METTPKPKTTIKFVRRMKPGEVSTPNPSTPNNATPTPGTATPGDLTPISSVSMDSSIDDMTPINIARMLSDEASPNTLQQGNNNSFTPFSNNPNKRNRRGMTAVELSESGTGDAMSDPDSDPMDDDAKAGGDTEMTASEFNPLSKRGAQRRLRNMKKKNDTENPEQDDSVDDLTAAQQDGDAPTTSTTSTTTTSTNTTTDQTTADIESPQSKRLSKKPKKYNDGEDTNNTSSATPMDTSSSTPQARKPGRPPKKAAQPADDESGGEQAGDGDKKGKGSKTKKSQPNALDIRPCWYGTCTKADRSLKLLRPSLVPTCKTHAIKSESRLHEMLGKGFWVEEKGNKDTVCGICGESTKRLTHCANEECAFGFCEPCIDFVMAKYDNKPVDDKWQCWVCNAIKVRGKERERTRWVREMVHPSSYQQQPRKVRTPKTSSTTATPNLTPVTPNLQSQLQQQQLQLQGTQQQSQQGEDAFGPGKRKKKSSSTPEVRGKKRTLEGEELISAPGSPASDASPSAVQYHSIMSPERKPITPVDFFIDQSFNSIKFFNNLLENPSAEMLAQFKTLVSTMNSLRMIRWSNEYTMVWRSIEELALLFKRNLESSQTILSMQQEMKALDDDKIKSSNNITRNQPLERAISRVYEHHQLSNMIEKECTSARNVLVISIDNAQKTIEEIHKNFEKDVQHDKVNEQRINNELAQLEDQMKKTMVDHRQLKTHEEELVGQLTTVRTSISNLEAIRDSLTKRCSDLKIETLLSKNTISERETDIRVKQVTLENEIGALNALINLIEGVYWGHEYFYGTEIGSCEKAISERLTQINQRMDLTRNDIPLAYSLRPATIREQITEDDGSETVVTVNKDDESISFLNPFKTLCIYHTACMEHNVPNFHLEKPDRIRIAIGIINEFSSKYPGIVEVFNTPAEVDLRYVMAVHDAHYIKKLETQLPPENSDYETHLESDNSGAMVMRTQRSDDETLYDTFVSNRSMKAALRAAGSVCAAVDAVTKLGYHRTFCAIRPPGHHAGRFGRTSDAPSQGYCLINNVAIGAKYASLTAGYSRIAVVDFDVHHGNGTQEILSGDDNFLFVSIHVIDEKRYFYPGTGRDQGDTPREDGTYDSNVLNIGLKRFASSSAFIQAWTKKIIPRLEAYKPQLIFLSAGFDGHKDDPTNALKLTEEDYYTVTKMIKAVAAKYARGRIISVLEGGYGIERSNSLQRCVNAHLKALVEDSNNEILYSQVGAGDFGLVKKIYNGVANSTIRDPNKQGDIENITIYNNIARDYLESIKQAPTPPSSPPADAPSQSDGTQMQALPTPATGASSGGHGSGDKESTKSSTTTTSTMEQQHQPTLATTTTKSNVHSLSDTTTPPSASALLNGQSSSSEPSTSTTTTSNPAAAATASSASNPAPPTSGGQQLTITSLLI
ncbi:hypothetical protein SAMD00019534_065740 [Acytostelium subglobosum LB1]|uniref:hypothetical protein n=1 Tax=Acytostelium subglobosum LB1 TaxID=1410327 RepID=UPI000644ED4C|nr:hypothetical protein SAMD00019534_065740 [Acytostelium subglobosum LB1]GAM23399.1 hypothetical protein SAMD00019534_065740 [Acytostelium subglobosum LB1]|eukprot:XP_012753848.1 hypothetical protein SAMD00019534_065740 [Acytostelium subglobosum LB1]